MTSFARTATLPFDHLAAELTAFPLVSEAALTHPLTHLDPNMSEATAALWRAAERELLASAPAISLDELVAMRDGYWFGDAGNRPRPMQHHLRAVTRVHLEFFGGGVVPRRPSALSGPLPKSPPLAQVRRSWMWLTFALPADLLLAVSAKERFIPTPDIFPPAVHELLKQGFAETHLHVGASLDFPTVWGLLLARLASPGIRDKQLEAPGAMLTEGRAFADWLIRAAIARAVLADFLTADHPGPFLGYVLGPRFRRRVIDQVGSVNFSMLMSALGDLVSGTLSDIPRPLFQGAYASLVGTRGEQRPSTLSAARVRDPLSRLFRVDARTTEQRYVCQACLYLDAREHSGQADEPAAQVFWQTVRIRAMFYRYLTQRPLTPGLPWFMRFYDRMTKARGELPPLLMVEAAAERSGDDAGLTSLEMRASPDAAIRDLRLWVEAASTRNGNGAGAHRTGQAARPDGPANGHPGAEQALVFHFLKMRGGEVKPGVPHVRGAQANADPDVNVNPGGFRFSKYFCHQRVGAVALATLLHRWPRVQLLVRGVDVCSDELAVPMWVLRPLVMYVRNAATMGAQFLRRFPGPQPEPLRTTVHAGEDFAHLLTGLRHVHEAIEILELREGDRIGHAIALGVEAVRWTERVGRVAMPVQDRVLDLVWEWTWWSQRGRGGSAARLAYLDREISILGERWFGEPITPLRVEHLRNDLCDDNVMARTGFPDGGRPELPHPDRKRGELLLKYLANPVTFRRGREIILVNPAEEAQALTEISDSLRDEVAHRGLAIELNPTSNLLVGDLGDLRYHPLWRLSPPIPDAKVPRIAVTVGSDDPLVFNSSLATEYQLLFDSLVLAGLTDAQALDWLDRVRRTSLDRRFTTPSLSADELFEVVNLKSLDPLS